MSMMMPPEAPPGVCRTSGLAGGDDGRAAPPMDAMSSTPMPAEGGIEGLLAALGGGGGPPDGGLEGLGACPVGIAEEAPAAEEEMDRRRSHPAGDEAPDDGDGSARTTRSAVPGSPRAWAHSRRSSAASRSGRRFWRTRVADTRGSTPEARRRSIRGTEHPAADELSLVAPGRGGGAFLASLLDGQDREPVPRLPGDRGDAARARRELALRPDDAVHPPGDRGDAGDDPGAEAEVGGQPAPLPGEPLEEILARRQSGAGRLGCAPVAMDDDNFAAQAAPLRAAGSDRRGHGGEGRVGVRGQGHRRASSRWRSRSPTTSARSARLVHVAPRRRISSTVIRDGPSMVVRDVRDFFWPERRKTVEDAAWIDRPHMDDLRSSSRRRSEAGFYKNVDELKEARNSPGRRGLRRPRAGCSGRSERNTDLIEVLEYWTDDRVITVGGRAVVLDSRPNPFRIKRKPFVVCSGLPDAFQIVGISVVESLAQLQEYLWTLQNQRIDALRLLTNVITLIRSDVDDPDALSSTPALSGSWRIRARYPSSRSTRLRRRSRWRPSRSSRATSRT